MNERSVPVAGVASLQVEFGDYSLDSRVFIWAGEISNAFEGLPMSREGRRRALFRRGKAHEKLCDGMAKVLERSRTVTAVTVLCNFSPEGDDYVSVVMPDLQGDRTDNLYPPITNDRKEYVTIYCQCLFDVRYSFSVIDEGNNGG
jgi:hypothetical protein